MRKIILLFVIYCMTINFAWVLENHENPYDFTITKPTFH
jgi:hypothetical protein